MPRIGRFAPGGFVYHVINRAVGRATLFRTENDYLAFQTCLRVTVASTGMKVLTYCVMPNHWHLLLWPDEDGDLAKFMMRLTNMHVRRWMTAHQRIGMGHLYQGRYKSFPCQDDRHFLTVARYIERNPLRANLVEAAEDWPWSGAGQGGLEAASRVVLGRWPVEPGEDWGEQVNEAQTEAELEAIRKCIRKQSPFGDERWVNSNRRALGWVPPGKRGRPAAKGK